MAFVWALLLIVAVLACWSLTFFGMPGNWLMVGVTSVYAIAQAGPSRLSISGQTLLVLLLLAALGEIIELAASALGVAKVGGSRRGAALALLGSMVGGLVGVLVSLPVPVIGTIVGTLLFASLGALAGAMLGEAWKGKSCLDIWAVGKAAFWGRLFGTVAKTLLGVTMVALVIAALLAI